MSNYLEPKIIERKKLSLFEHPGLLVNIRGQAIVIHNSFKEGKVVVSSWNEYAEGHEVIHSKNYTPEISGYEMQQNAMNLLGKPWRPWYNCQHFITEVSNLPIHSPQINKAAYVTILSLGFTILFNK